MRRREFLGSLFALASPRLPALPAPKASSLRITFSAITSRKLADSLAQQHLNSITGGLSADEFIAQQTREQVRLLREIKMNIDRWAHGA